MSDTWIENAIVQSIDMIVGRRISQAKFDKTIKGKIKSCSDETIGEYIVRYQDSDLIVYASNTGNHYVKDDQVLIHVPEGDLTKRKTILGNINSIATTYQQIPAASTLYNRVGTNIITEMTINPIKLSSYKDGIETIWTKNGGDSNLISLNEEALNKYIKLGNGLALGMYVRTDFDDSQIGGDYGVIINLKFQDANGAAATRSYVVNSRDVIGNPYRLVQPTYVEYFINDINIDQFKQIQSIQVFRGGFPQDQEKENIFDIFISDLQIFGASGLTEEQQNGYSLNIDYSKDGDTIKIDTQDFATKYKNYLNNLRDLTIQYNNSQDATQKENISKQIAELKKGFTVPSVQVKAELKVKGKITTKDVTYFWFKQNGMIFRGNAKYSMYGGEGWECINYYDQDKKRPVPRTKPQFTFVPNSSSFQVSNGTAALSEKATKIKCVAVIDNQDVASNECTIYNSLIDSTPQLISSDRVTLDVTGEEANKTIYYLDNGNPTLTCVIKKDDGTIINQSGKKAAEREYIYNWTIVPARGDAIDCSSKDSIYHQDSWATQEERDFTAAYDKIVEKVSTMAKADKEKYLNLSETKATIAYVTTEAAGNLVGENETGVKYFEVAGPLVEKIRSRARIYGNRFYYFPISSISGSSRIICTVVKNDQTKVIKGSASITLYNKAQLTGMYSLNLENGTQVFQYDKKGNSPTSPQLQKPLVIKPLTFTFLDNTGKQISFEQIINSSNQGYVRWQIPIENTMLSTSLTGSTNGVYENVESFPYSIASIYDSKKNQNNIKLTVKYKDIILQTYTNFTFPKDGDPGTNGTDLVAKIVPTNEDADAIYVNNFGQVFDNQGRDVTGITPYLYNNSVKMPASYTFHNDKVVNEKSNNAGILKQKSSYINIDTNNKITNAYNGTKSIKKQFEEEIITNHPVDIIRKYCQVNGLKYYAEYPICYNFTKASTKKGSYAQYRIKLKPKTGFKYVVYSQDGTLPDYDNTEPFSLRVEEMYYDQSTDTVMYTEIKDVLTYQWNIIGNLKIKQGKTASACIIEPKEKYDGNDLTSAVICKVSKNGTDIGFIHIPIYMSINRYGHAALNDWDGNGISLQFDENGKPTGSTILAPQMGAGQKESNNSFTGVLMGVERPQNGAEDGSNDEVGLFGYNKGQRSIFLDSKTGKAEFGTQGKGRIIIDPRNNKAQIYSGNYYKDDGSLNNAGMLIDFTTPQIKFGSGKFTVNPEGQIHAAGGGDIGGWLIGDKTLYSSNRYVGMNSDPENTKIKKTDTIEPLKVDSQKGNMAFWAGSGSGDEGKNFYVTHKGYLFSKSGKIANWDIGTNALSYTYKTDHTGVGFRAPSSYSSDNIAIYAGKLKDNNQPSKDSTTPFFVRYDGYLFSKSGKIAKWDITEDALTNGRVGLGSTTVSSSVFNGGNNISARIWANSSQGNLIFALSDSGYLYSRRGQIGGWNIQDNKLWAKNKADGTAGIRLNSDGSMGGGSNPTQGTGWTINSDGSSHFNDITTDNITANNGTINDITANNITANNGGSIGGWTINSGNLASSSGSITLYSNGSMEGGSNGSNWKISTNGDAKFNQLSGKLTGELGTGNGGSIKTGSPGGNGLYAPHSGTPKIYDSTDTLEPQEGKLVSALVLNRYVGPFSVATAYVSETVVTSVNFETKTVSTASIKVPADTRKLSTVVAGWNEATKTKTVKFMTASTVSQDSSEQD